LRNVELKARYPDLDAGERIARQLGARHAGLRRQVDTYFNCTSGRLKLRESSRTGATLIGYHRPDRTDAKTSSYRLIDVPDAPALRETLSETLGQWLVVDKQRLVYLWENVRIHLDRVEGLGTFLEFEAVLGPDDTEEEGQRKVAHLTDAFGLRPEDLISHSYSDMMAEGILASGRRKPADGRARHTHTCREPR